MTYRTVRNTHLVTAVLLLVPFLRVNSLHPVIQFICGVGALFCAIEAIVFHMASCRQQRQS